MLWWKVLGWVQSVCWRLTFISIVQSTCITFAFTRFLYICPYYPVRNSSYFYPAEIENFAGGFSWGDWVSGKWWTMSKMKKYRGQVEVSRRENTLVPNRPRWELQGANKLIAIYGYRPVNCCTQKNNLSTFLFSAFPLFSLLNMLLVDTWP